MIAWLRAEENKAVTDMLVMLDEALKKMNEYDSYGLWNIAGYFLSDDMSTSEIAASNYRSLMNGDNYGREVSAINSWRSNDLEVVGEYRDLTTYLSTGSGKSNTVYQILMELRQDRVPFLVIEPAKGEYKDVFGHLPDVNVFSTNPNIAPLININPFKFPRSIHVLEHIDGLVEIFSVCWPMYDAMPAFFKDAILGSYETVGWDLGSSTFEGKHVAYPDFEVLAEQLDKLITNSDYAAEIKSNYRGALLTRVKSLAIGLNKYIFTEEQTPYEKLFDENCILDISRVKSSETKALLMGLMVYILNEYRVTQKTENNNCLHHVTVLEEAHNLLKNTSGGESNLIGKSVEMITNTIAEIRTYGEGFVIVDQSPSSVDIAAIKNTNTKIVLRTPEANDREAVGRSMGLSTAQVNEIAKLPSGVAVVYQNNWISPVLTLVDKAKVKEENLAAQLKREGHTVDYDIRANYSGTRNSRPTSFEPHITVDGKEYELSEGLKKIYNTAEETTVQETVINIKEKFGIANETGLKSGAVAAGLTCAMSSVDNISACINGKISSEEAAIEIAKDTAVAGGAAYGTAFISAAVSETMKGSSKALLQRVGNSCLPAAVTVFAVDSADSIIDYAKGEIDGSELVYELGDSASSVAGGFASGAAGAEIGAAVGTAIAPGVETVAGTVVGGVVGGVVGTVVASEAYATTVEAGTEGAKFLAEKAETLAKGTVKLVKENLPEKLDEVKSAFNDFAKDCNLPFRV